MTPNRHGSQGWRLVSLRGGKGTVGCTKFLTEAQAFELAIPAQQPLRLRGEVTENAFKVFVQNYLKNGKAGGLDNTNAEMIEFMSNEELAIMCKWVNSILTTGEQAQRMTASEMQGRIRLLQKGGDTATKPSDWRPVVLLNCTSQLVMHILNQRLRTLVERAGSCYRSLETGQAGGRQGKGTDINYEKLQQIITGWVHTDKTAQCIAWTSISAILTMQWTKVHYG